MKFFSQWFTSCCCLGVLSLGSELFLSAVVFASGKPPPPRKPAFDPRTPQTFEPEKPVEISPANEQLLDAAENGNFKWLVDALEKGADINFREPRKHQLKTPYYGNSPLLIAMMTNDERLAEQILHVLRDHPDKVRDPNWFLDVRARNAKKYTIDTDVEVQNWTPMLFACHFGRRELVEILRNEFAVSLEDGSSGWTPLIAAASRGCLDVVQFLIDQNVSLEATDSRGYTALCEAVEREQIHVARILLGARADANHAVREHQQTPLHLAAHRGATGLFALLLFYRADPARRTVSQERGLHDKTPCEWTEVAPPGPGIQKLRLQFKIKEKWTSERLSFSEKTQSILSYLLLLNPTYPRIITSREADLLNNVLDIAGQDQRPFLQEQEQYVREVEKRAPTGVFSQRPSPSPRAAFGTRTTTFSTTTSSTLPGGASGRASPRVNAPVRPVVEDSDSDSDSGMPVVRQHP